MDGQTEMLKQRRKASALVAVAIVICGAYSHAVNAQSQPPQAAPKSALAISPPTFELSANPGDKLKNSLRVDNISGTPLEVAVDKRNFTALGEDGGVNLSEAEGRYSLASWMRVSPEKVTIPAGESKTFDYTIAVPTFAEPGGRFGSIIFKTTIKPVDGRQSGVAIGQEIGALIFVKIAGEVKEKAAITDFSAGEGLHEFGPVDFDIKVKNDGNVQFKPTGTITISNFFGQKVATIPIDAQNVLPDATRKMAAKWNNGWLFGKYEATLSLVYGSNKQILTASTTFWGFPYKLIAFVTVIAGILGFLIYKGRRRMRRAFKVLFGRE